MLNVYFHSYLFYNLSVCIFTNAARIKGIFEDTLFIKEISNWLYQSSRRKYYSSAEGNIIPLTMRGDIIPLQS
jgi:hypothetical protein